MIELIDRRKGKESIREIDLDYVINYNGRTLALRELEVNGLKIIDIILKDDDTLILYKRGLD